MDSLRQDLRLALRTLRKSPGFTLAAALSLALGLGLNAALFSLVDAVLLRPLPVEAPEELTAFFTSDADGYAYGTTSYPDYQALAEASSFDGALAHSLMFAALNRPAGQGGDAGGSRLLVGEIVSGNYFDLLGVPPALGRTLQPADALPGAPPVAVVSDGFFRRELGGDPAQIGRPVRIRGREVTVVGVAPARFTGLLPGVAPEMWVPVSLEGEVEPVGWQSSVASPGATRLERRGNRWLFVKARLADGVPFERARAEAELIMQRLAAEHPESNRDRRALLTPAGAVRIHPLIDSALTPGAGVLMAVVGLVLLVACANVANMLLARAHGRRREMAVRLAVGAGRGRLIRQLLTESVLLSLLGGAGGLVLAWWATELAAGMPLPVPVRLAFGLGLEPRVALFTLGLALATGLLFGLAPALASARRDLVTSLRGQEEAAGGRLGARGLLVVAQVALTALLLVAAGTLVHGLVSSFDSDLGFDHDRLALASFSLDLARYSDSQAEGFITEALERLGGQPGIAGVAAASRQPLSLNVHIDTVFAAERPPAAGESGLAVDVTRAGEGYFGTLGVPVLAGRDFDSSDRFGGEPVAVITRSLADRLWPGESALGKELRNSRQGPGYRVVGVVADHAVRSVGEAPRPLAAFSFAGRTPKAFTVLVRAERAGGAAGAAALLRRELLAIEPDLVLMEQGTMADAVATNLLPLRIGAALVGTFGLLALALAAVGLYGVIAYAVSQRTLEIGIRMALGADPGGVLRLVLRQGMVLVAIGLAVGVPAALGLTQLLAGAFRGVDPVAPLPIAAAVGLLAAVALAANLLPARRAARLTPVTALKGK